MDPDMKSLAVRFDMQTGLSPQKDTIKRHLSEMRHMYADRQACESLLEQGDRLIYEFHDLGLPGEDSHIAFGTSIVYPGTVGDEYHMTKGHFHEVLETAEVYYCLRGSGYMLMENPEGHSEERRLEAGLALYVPPRYAHRSVNTSPSEPLVTFFAFRGDAGHDYGTIETRGFRRRVVERDGEPRVIDNPDWK